MNEEIISDLNIYIQYNRLNAKELAMYLTRFSDISDKIAQDFFIRFIGIDEDTVMPTLDIESINTGESIKFTLVEGWKPKLYTDDENDIIVGLPKKLGIPLVAGWLIISGATQYQDFRNKILDNKLKEIELKIKETEYNRLITENNDEKLIGIDTLNTKIPELKQIVIDTVKSIAQNPDITSFKVNDIEIKKDSTQQSAKRQ